MTDESTSDRDLLRSWGRGDEAAGTQLVRRHFASLARFFRSRAAGHHVDLMQRTWLGCIESRTRVPDEVPFKVYLMGIARRVLLHHFREHQKAARAQHPLREPRDSGHSPSGVMVMAAEEKLLLQALRRLPLDMQLTLELYYWEELSVDHVATVLEVPTGTVKSRLHHARRQLRAQIAAVDPDPELAKSTAANLDRWARSIRRFLGRDSSSSDSAKR